MINHAEEMKAIAEAADYGDIEVILVDVCERLGVPGDTFDPGEIQAWVDENGEPDDIDLIAAILAKCAETKKGI